MPQAIQAKRKIYIKAKRKKLGFLPSFFLSKTAFNNFKPFSFLGSHHKCIIFLIYRNPRMLFFASALGVAAHKLIHTTGGIDKL